MVEEISKASALPFLPSDPSYSLLFLSSAPIFLGFPFFPRLIFLLFCVPLCPLGPCCLHLSPLVFSLLLLLLLISGWEPENLWGGSHHVGVAVVTVGWVDWKTPFGAFFRVQPQLPPPAGPLFCLISNLILSVPPGKKPSNWLWISRGWFSQVWKLSSYFPTLSRTAAEKEA